MLGAWLAHQMFDTTVLQFSAKLRSGSGQWIAEAVATFGLPLVILRAPQTRAAPNGRHLQWRRLLVHRVDVPRENRTLG